MAVVWKENDRIEVTCEALSQCCHEEDILPEERNINNKGRKKHWVYDVVFRVIDARNGPFGNDSLLRLTFKPLDPMDRYKPGTQWDLPLWLLSEDPTRILAVHTAAAGTTDEAAFQRTNWQLMAVIKHGGKDKLPLPDSAKKPE